MALVGVSHCIPHFEKSYDFSRLWQSSEHFFAASIWVEGMARVVTSLGIWWWVHFLICVTSSFWYCPMQEVDKNPLAIPWSFTWFLQLPAAKCRSEVQDWMGRAVLERLAGLGIIGLRSEDYFHWLHLSLEFHHRVFCPSMCSKKKHSFLLCFSDGHGSISIGSFERGDEHPIGPAVLVLKD